MLEAFVLLVAQLVLIAMFCYANGYLWRKFLPRFRNPRRVYLIFVFPGTVVHELCHALASVLLLVPVKRVNLFVPLSGDRGRVDALGQVETVGGGPIRMGLISFAPFLGGLASMFAMLYFLCGVKFTVSSFRELPQALRGFFASPWVLPVLLVCWVLSLGILPSRTDIRNSLFFIVVIVGLIALAIYLLSRFEAINNTEAAIQWLWAANSYLFLLLVFLAITALVLAAITPVRNRPRRPMFER